MEVCIPIIIPAYEPDNRLIDLIIELKDNNFIIVVNDGSGKEYNYIFDRVREIIGQNGIVLSHVDNKGKGRALKTAFRYVQNSMPNALGVVTADSDGQHDVFSINKVKNTLEKSANKLVLGVRDFDGMNIPWKSRLGNKLTNLVFSCFLGININDTQTGLRGIPRDFMIEMIDLEGERFEYETKMLLSTKNRCGIEEISISTIYDSSQNHQTHFRPIRDSFKIYVVILNYFLKFFLSSALSSIVDLGFFAFLCRILKGIDVQQYIIYSTIVARIISMCCNFTVNYFWVFRSRQHIGSALVKYMLLALLIMLSSAFLTNGLVYITAINSEVICKVIVDSILFLVSYKVQRADVFKE